MNRAELQQLAQDRIEDAGVLLAAGRWPAAYYLAGYAVECALKSCILAHLDRTGQLFRDRRYLRSLADCWTHDFEQLVDLAGLTKELGLARGADPALHGYWTLAEAWSETSRYETRTRDEAEGLFEAITHDPDGVLRWIQQHW